MFCLIPLDKTLQSGPNQITANLSSLPLFSWDFSLKLFPAHRHALSLRLDWKTRWTKHENIFRRVCFSACTFPVCSPMHCSLGFHQNLLPLSPCSDPSCYLRNTKDVFQGQLVLHLPIAVDMVNHFFLLRFCPPLSSKAFPGDWLAPFHPPHLSPPGTFKITYLNQDFTLRVWLISLFTLSLE